MNVGHPLYTNIRFRELDPTKLTKIDSSTTDPADQNILLYR